MNAYTDKNWYYYQNHLKKNEIETVLCAAIWYCDYPIEDDFLLSRLPFNINKGVVISGHRHHNCMHIIGAITNKRDCELGDHVQGFLTNCNRFVTRREAAELGWNAGQLKTKPVDKDGNWDVVYSEDFY